MEAILKFFLSTFFKYFSKLSPGITAKIAWSFFCKPRIRKKPLSEFESDLLKLSKQYTITSGEFKIAVYEWESTANLNNSKTILCSHGWGGHALNFSHIIQALLANGFNVVAYDSPAHGKSTGSQTNLLRNTQALLDVAKNKESIHVLIGHSFGTMANTYAVDLCKDNSQFNSVNKQILIAGPNRLYDIFAVFTQAMNLPDKILDLFLLKVEKLANRKIETMSTSAFLQNYAGETLVIHDHKDRLVPFSEAESVAKSACAELYPTTGCGHFRILAANSVIDKIVNFVK